MFRERFFGCLTSRAHALFELADAVLCAYGPITSLADLSLTPEHRRVIERSIASLLSYYRLSIRYDRYANRFCAFLTLAATLTCYKKLAKSTT